MGRWGWWLAVAAAVLGGWWWWRRDKAHKGQGNPLGVPAGATAGGALAVLQTSDKTFKIPFEPKLSPKVELPMVGLGTVAPPQIVNSAAQAKPAPPPAAEPPKKCVARKAFGILTVGKVCR